MKELAEQLARFRAGDCILFNTSTANKYGDIVANSGLALGQTYSIHEIMDIRDKMGDVETREEFADIAQMTIDINPLILIGTRPKKKGPVRGS